MKTIKKNITFIILLLPLLSFSQKVENIHFEQVGKQIHIYYDLKADEEYTIQVFCSTDNGQSWDRPLKQVSGEVGENQKSGISKTIVWDVLAEREELAGNVRFKIDILPSNTGFFTDARDGQTYKWVKIGMQVWMAENLNYNSGNSWCYDNMTMNCNKYGRLYNLNAARKACPAGWNLPTDKEWKTLEMHLGMSQSKANQTSLRGTDEGKKLKSTSGWDYNGNGTDTAGFTALPCGSRRPDGDVVGLGNSGTWWSATEGSSGGAWARLLGYNTDKVYRSNGSREDGLGVRCLRD